MRTVSMRLSDLDGGNKLIPIGFQGENEYTTVNIDCKKIFDQHPDAVPALAVTPPKGDSYPAVVVRDGDIVSWTVCDSDLIYEGSGAIQLTFVIDETVIGKTYKARTKVLGSIEPSGETPTPIQNWLIQAAAALQALPAEVASAVAALMGAMVGVGETLDPDDDVTVNYDPTNNTLTIGVPHGRDGVDGHTPAITANKVGKVATLYVDGAAIVTISDGTDGDPTALIDDTSTALNRTWSAKKISDEQSSLLTEITNAQEDITDVKNALETAMDGISEQQGVEITGGIIAFDKTGKTISQIAISDTSVTSANITRCGKNIIPKFSSGTGGSNLSWTVASDGTITFSGSSTSDVLLRLYNQNIPCKSGEKKTVAFFNNMADSNNRLSFFGVTTAGNLQVNLNSVNKINTVTHGANAPITELRLRIPKDVDWTGLIIKPMMVVGDVAGDFEEYNGQTYSVNVSDGVVQGGSIIYLDGVNTMWSSVGDITVTYDQTGNIKKYVDDQFAAISLFPSFYKYVQRTYSSGTQKYLYVYYKSGNKVIQWTLMNTPASGSNSDTWQIGGVNGYDFDGNTLSNEVGLAMNGEFELAIKEHGAEDYCGGVNHGDENTDVFKLFIDGKQISELTTLDENFHAFNRIDAFEIATINRCNTPSENIITHQKIWTFENGKVRVHQTCKFLEQIQVDVMMVCMFKAVRSVYSYGIRQGSVDIETMTDATFTKKYTTGNDAYYLYYGDNATAKINAKTDNDGSVRQSVLWINNASDSNKLYIGYWGINDSANPVTVPENTIVTEETEYDVAFD